MSMMEGSTISISFSSPPSSTVVTPASTPRTANMKRSTTCSMIDRNYTWTNNDLEEKKKKALNILGASTEEIARHRCLLRMGLTEDDIYKSQLLWKMQEMQNIDKEDDEVKLHELTGYTRVQINRVKCMKVLGTSEEDISNEVTTRLASLGVTHLQTSGASSPTKSKSSHI